MKIYQKTVNCQKPVNRQKTLNHQKNGKSSKTSESSKNGESSKINESSKNGEPSKNNILKVDLSNDIKVLFGKIGEIFQEYEIREILDTIFRYLYTSEIDIEIIDFEEWLCLVRVADYFAMEGLIQNVVNFQFYLLFVCILFTFYYNFILMLF